MSPPRATFATTKKIKIERRRKCESRKERRVVAAVVVFIVVVVVVVVVVILRAYFFLYQKGLTGGFEGKKREAVSSKREREREREKAKALPSLFFRPTIRDEFNAR